MIFFEQPAACDYAAPMREPIANLRLAPRKLIDLEIALKPAGLFSAGERAALRASLADVLAKLAIVDAALANPAVSGLPSER
jgi:hypothetical protein